MHTLKKTRGLAQTVIAGSLLFSCVAQAEMINLTYDVYNGSEPVVGGNPVVTGGSASFTKDAGAVTFSRDFEQPSGTGVWQPFLQIDQLGNATSEQAYNTSVGPGLEPFETKSSPQWSKDVLLSSLVANADGDYEFYLDINEPGQLTKSLLSLDGLRLYATDKPGQTDDGVLSNPGDQALGDWDGNGNTLLWSMDIDGPGNGNNDEDNFILLDAKLDDPEPNAPGSGTADMRMVVDGSIIDAAKGDPNLTHFILWSRFGLTEDIVLENLIGNAIAEAGFEEWRGPISGNGGGGPSGVPVPTPLALFGLGAALLGWRVRAQR